MFRYKKAIQARKAADELSDAEKTGSVGAVATGPVNIPPTILEAAEDTKVLNNFFYISLTVLFTMKGRLELNILMNKKFE